jgi:CheY-like chemotaxis protein
VWSWSVAGSLEGGGAQASASSGVGAMILCLVVMTLAAVAAGVAVMQTRAARAALAASEEKCRQLIEQGPGHGTTTRASGPDDDSRPAGPRTIEGGSKVLIVDDDARVRDLIKLVLVRAGHDVVAVAGAHDALTELNRHPDIRLLLIDVIMPEMSGYDLAAAARKIVPGAHIIFMSGFACDRVRQPAADGFLAKPFTIESLTNIVEQAVAVPS